MRKGFSLIEIIVVLTIMGILMGAAALSTRSFSQDKQLDQDVDKMLNLLNLAKQKTISRDIPPSSNCTQYQGTTNVFLGYSVVFTSPTTYVLRFRCSSGNIDVPGYSYTLSQTTVTTVPPQLEIFFQYPYGMTNTTQLFVVKHKNVSKCRSITIFSNGSLRRSIPSTSC